ncbi:MAG: hypothetical protein RL235_117 [Chlamydiota bacterium]|jgi:ribonuclease HII
MPEWIAEERRLRAEGFSRIAGVDEAGRGPLAGPVYAAACVLPEGLVIAGLNDSKQLKPALREQLFEQMVHTPGLQYGVAWASVEEIDKHNILQATLKAMRRAVRHLPAPPDYILIDGNQKPRLTTPSACIIKGDAKVACIAAASVFAKVLRDRAMRLMAEAWPGYGFERHFGYPTQLHRAMLAQKGPTPIHRKSFL